MSLLSRTTRRSLRCHREHRRSQRRQHTPRCHGDRRCAIPPAHANETRWVSRTPKCTVFKRKTLTMPCRAAKQAIPSMSWRHIPLYPWPLLSSVEQLEYAASARSCSAEASRSALAAEPIRGEIDPADWADQNSFGHHRRWK